MDASKIKLIIWDLDETFWNGTISEQKVAPVKQACDLVLLSSKKGIVNSICSKNDEKPCIDKLKEWGLDKYFVFNSINWEPKGQRIKDTVESMNLRPCNVLFIDDNKLNLEEAKFFCPDIMTMLPDKIGELYAAVSMLDKNDEKLSRLESYKVLEKKNKIKKSIGSNEEFLRQSNIHVDFHSDCAEHIDRLHELIFRANQLNFTKVRSTKDELKALLEDKNAKCEYITAYDKYGEYGIVGFYAVKDNTLVHFLFSCRTLGMGIEQYTYEKIGCPKLDIVGDVSVKIGKNEPTVTWINQDNVKTDNEFEDIKNTGFKVLIKGPCDLNQIFSFIKNEDIFDCEFTYVSREKQSLGVAIEGMNHTSQIVNAYSITDEETAEICKLPICDSQMYSDSIYKNKYGMIFISILTDANLGVYRNKNNGAVFAFGEYIYPLTDKAMWKKYINKEVYTANCDFKEKDLQKIAEEYEFLGRLTPKQTAENLRFIYEHIKTDTELVILLGCEREYKDNKLEAWVNRHNDHKEYNSAVRKEFDGCKNVTLFDVNEYITSDDDFNDSVNHYKKRVYYLMAQKFTEMINAHANADVAKQTSKAKLAYLTLKQKIKKIVKYLSYDVVFATLNNDKPIVIKTTKNDLKEGELVKVYIPFEKAEYYKDNEKVYSKLLSKDTKCLDVNYKKTRSSIILTLPKGVKSKEKQYLVEKREEINDVLVLKLLGNKSKDTLFVKLGLVDLFEGQFVFIK